MKGSILLIIAFLFSSGAFPPHLDQDTDPSAELAKATQLNLEVTKLFDQHHYKEALPMAEQVVQIRQRLLKADDDQLAIAFSNLGEIYHGLKKDEEAAKAFRAALAIYETHPDRNVVRLAKTLERVGYGLYLKRDFKNAEPLYLRAVVLQEKTLGPTD